MSATILVNHKCHWYRVISIYARYVLCIFFYMYIKLSDIENRWIDFCPRIFLQSTFACKSKRHQLISLHYTSIYGNRSYWRIWFIQYPNNFVGQDSCYIIISESKQMKGRGLTRVGHDFWKEILFFYQWTSLIICCPEIHSLGKSRIFDGLNVGKGYENTLPLL